MAGTPTLLIFDVDGTLTHSAGLTRIAYEATVKELYGVENSTQGIAASGRTDPDIFREILERIGIPCTDLDGAFRAYSKVYIQHLEKLLFSSDEPRLHNGVRVLLDKLSAMPYIYLALGTGNIEQGAYLKLQRHGVARLFPVGGFGSDSSDRVELINIAYQRAQRHYRIPFAKRDTWVIGDTPNDILAGRRLGANTIAVATGVFSREELDGFEPTALFQDLEDWERFIAVVTDGLRSSRSAVGRREDTL